MKGIVEVKRAGTDEWIRARRNMPLNPGDTVRTGKNSYADLGCSSGEFTQATGSYFLSELIQPKLKIGASVGAQEFDEGFTVLPTYFTLEWLKVKKGGQVPWLNL